MDKKTIQGRWNSSSLEEKVQHLYEYMFDVEVKGKKVKVYSEEPVKRGRKKA